ncbi:hypothetical protein Hamer_G015174 [Homarus americanus]|uniref:Mucin-5AC n=2 Tax=Homarus americanus TaxID=6706 RepID=A0A8J5N8X5_HOMAM|nr:hypothetical protein Hamer_G015174 [Homarus americanus]
MVLLASSQSRALPLRAHGGVIFGSDFLRILDPRARPPAHNDPSDMLRAATTSIRTQQRPPGGRHAFRDDTATFLETPDTRGTHEASKLSSRNLRKLDPVVSSSSSSSSSQFTSSSSSSFSSSSSPSKENVSQHIDSVTVKPHARRLPQTAAASNYLIPDGKFTTPRSNSVKPTISPANTLTSSHRDNSDPLRPATSPAATNRPENTFNLPYDDYDYNYYYYLDDLYPLTSSGPEETVRATSNTEDTTKPSGLRFTEAIPRVGSSTRVTQSASTATSALSASSSQSHGVEARQTTSATPTLSPAIAKIDSTATIAPQRTSVVSTTTKRPTTKRSTYRYRSTTETTPGDKTSLDNPSATTSRPTVDPDNTRRTTATERPSESLSTNQEAPRTTTTTTKKPTESYPTPKPRTSVTVKTSARSSPPLTTQTPPTVDTKTTAPVITKPSAVITSELPEPEDQRPKGTGGGSPRHFRYTTPIPKEDSVVSVDRTQDPSAQQDNTPKKSLGSTSSSSVVVEVRVESPHREPRLMTAAEATPLVQTVTGGPSKATPAPTKTVHTVHPDHHTSSFLLSDPLMVDVVAEPTTSDQNPQVPLPRRPPPVATAEKTTTTTTPPPTTTTTTTTTTPTTTTTTEAATSPSPPQQQAQLDEAERLTTNKVDKLGANRGGNSEVQFETSVVEVSGSVGSDSQLDTKDTTPTTRLRGSPASLSRDRGTPQAQLTGPGEQFQTQRVSTSVSRTEARTAERVSSIKIYERLPQPTSSSTTPPPSTTPPSTTPPPSITTQDIVAVNATSNSSRLRIRLPFMRTPRAQQGLAPLGLAPFGQSPEGLRPFGESPAGMAPHGVVPGGLHPHGLSPQGYGRGAKLPSQNKTAINTTATQDNGTGLTFVDATVVEGGADANSTVGYVVEEPNVRRSRLEEKTPDGFIIGEYRVVDHSTGDVNGVRYTADGTADPHLIYETLMKFLEL